MSDWRGLFMRHLIDALARRNDLKLRLWSPPGEFPSNAKYAASPSETEWLAGLMTVGGIAHLMRTGGIRGLGVPIRLLRMLRDLYCRESAVDLYHINWLQNTLVLPRNDRPLLTTVLGTDMQLLKLPGMTSLLRRVFRHRKTAICPNAQWMVPELQRRFGDVAVIRFVPFGIEPRWFDLERKPESPAKWLCVSRLTRGKIGTLFEWGEAFFSSSRELHLFGPMQQEMQVPSWVRYHGPATPESLCSDWFPKASGLITLSQHAEGRPQVMLEAMAAGLPIIASRIPAHEDLLQDRQTGWLCNDAGDVALALEALDAKLANQALGLRAKAWVEANIGTWDDCAARYASVYEELMPTCQ
ncbi:MAG: glycosyltransferase family 4 protein [Gemmatimonadaceae bacterium]